MTYKFSPLSLSLLKDWRSNFKGIQWMDKKRNLIHGAIDNLLQNGKKAIETLEGEMSKSSEECGFCKWVDSCNGEIK